MSNLFKLLFADDESVVSSTLSEDPAKQNQTQRHDLTNPHRSQSISARIIIGYSLRAAVRGRTNHHLAKTII